MRAIIEGNPISGIIRGYISTDGIPFNTREACLQHEERLKNVKYFRVAHAPDLHEGRGLKKRIVIAVHALSDHEVYVEHFCYAMFGNRHAFVMGHYGSNAMVYNWAAAEINSKALEGQTIKYRIEDANVSEYIWEDSVRSEKDIVELKRLEGKAK